MSSLLMVGLLRTPLRAQRPAFASCVALRNLSTFSSRTTLLHTSNLLRGSPKQLLAPTPIRTLSLGSIFGPRKPASVPAPQVVANIAAVEAAADANPQDVEKQVALFEALLGTNVKAGYDVVISRWERMCGFDPSNPLLKSDAAFRLYLTALMKNGMESSINAAVRHRDSLLAIQSAPSTEAETVETAAAASDASATPAAAESTATSADASATATSSTASSTVASSSQAIAESVLARAATGTAPSSTGPLSADMSKLATALTAGQGGPNNPIVVTLAEPKGSWIPRLVRFLVYSAVFTFFMLVVFSVLLENSGLLKAGPRQAEFEPAAGKTYKFSDVHGVDEAKDELQEVVMFLKDPTNFTALGGKLPKGILLTGPPGTGKTMLARAVAGEAGVPFLFASGSEFDEMFVGVGAKRMRELFAAARKKQPAIIFIDELDAVGGRRTSRDSQYMRQTLNQLLTEMDGFLQNDGIIVIGATNFPDSLDPALVRPGRFDRHIAVPLPDVRGRTQILKHHMQNIVTESEVNLMVLARGTPGFSGADLQNMVNMAAVQASREGASAVNLKHFEWAKDRIVMGAERKSAFISDHVKKLTAYHEGGHALVALYTDGAMPLHKVTCVPRGHALGVTSQLPEDDMYSRSFKEYLADIDVCMGGRVAEELAYGPENVTSGASSDITKATNIARSMVKKWGFSAKIGPVYFNDRDGPISPSKQDEIETEVRKILTSGESRVHNLLKAKEVELHRLAAALVEHETLDAEEVRKVVKGEQIRNITEVIQEDLSRMSSESS
ncbi:ATP-dependent peptidase [Phanerochaete sordida]|uniref:ATP-dependent peptidase n=1 Tax=Phanerochaete sordida TaxID=48140 RepID=A0A9P3GKD5_9APHY|nr:ATP-dependent peptidase [Phanerochaete sordida]